MRAVHVEVVGPEKTHALWPYGLATIVHNTAILTRVMTEIYFFLLQNFVFKMSNESEHSDS